MGQGLQNVALTFCNRSFFSYDWYNAYEAGRNSIGNEEDWEAEKKIKNTYLLSLAFF